MFRRAGDGCTPRFLQRLQRPTTGQAASARAGSPAGSPPWLPLSHFHTRCCNLQKAGQKTLFFSSPPPLPPKNYRFREKTPRLLNLRRAISITLYIITSNLLTADYKVFFNHVLQREWHHSSPTEHARPPLCHLQSLPLTHVCAAPQGNVPTLALQLALPAGRGRLALTN